MVSANHICKSENIQPVRNGWNELIYKSVGNDITWDFLDIEPYEKYKACIKIIIPILRPKKLLNGTEGEGNSCMYKTIMKHITAKPWLTVQTHLTWTWKISDIHTSYT